MNRVKVNFSLNGDLVTLINLAVEKLGEKKAHLVDQFLKDGLHHWIENTEFSFHCHDLGDFCKVNGFKKPKGDFTGVFIAKFNGVLIHDGKKIILESSLLFREESDFWKEVAWVVRRGKVK